MMVNAGAEPSRLIRLLTILVDNPE